MYADFAFCQQVLKAFNWTQPKTVLTFSLQKKYKPVSYVRKLNCCLEKKTRVGSHTRLQMWMAAALDKAGEIEIEMVAPWLLRGCSVVMPSLFPGNVLVLDLSTNFYQPANTWYMEASPSSIWTTVFDLNRHFRPETAWASSLFFS